MTGIKVQQKLHVHHTATQVSDVPGTKPFCCSISSPEAANPSNNQIAGNSAYLLLQVFDKHVE